MPELPEVETLKRQLQVIRGKTVLRSEVDWAKMVKPLSVKEFQKRIKGQTIAGITRRAKVLLVDLVGPLTLAIHLKMTGQLIYVPKQGKLVFGGHPQAEGLKDLPNKFTHLILFFTDGSKLFFNDVRKFGWAKLINDDQYRQLVAGFGMEPLESRFSLEHFKSILNRYPKRNIKMVLMDQKMVAGVGNIYADETCFCAGVLPNRSVKSLKATEIQKLYDCVIAILKLGIEKKGTSSANYVQLSGQPGGMVPHLKVYGRKGQKCKRCRGIIQRITLNQRGTHFCPVCQE